MTRIDSILLVAVGAHMLVNRRRRISRVDERDEIVLNLIPQILRLRQFQCLLLIILVYLIYVQRLCIQRWLAWVLGNRLLIILRLNG